MLEPMSLKPAPEPSVLTAAGAALTEYRLHESQGRVRW